ncbi:hypothetical protein HYS72_01160 [Candidatus Pacearchaeota archaeon]|nr:hypothetical protein [Candidatus Pacearchaeota archaeon]
MIKINFRGKEMSLLEAKVLRIGLKTGVIKLELKEEEKKAYTNRKELHIKKVIHTQILELSYIQFVQDARGLIKEG